MPYYAIFWDKTGRQLVKKVTFNKNQPIDYSAVARMVGRLQGLPARRPSMNWVLSSGRNEAEALKLAHPDRLAAPKLLRRGRGPGCGA